MGEIFLCLISINSTTGFACRGIKFPMRWCSIFFFYVGPPIAGMLFFWPSKAFIRSDTHIFIFTIMVDGATSLYGVDDSKALLLSHNWRKAALLDETRRNGTFSSFTRRSYGVFLRSNETALHASFFLKKTLSFSLCFSWFFQLLQKNKSPRPSFEPTIPSSKLVLRSEQ